MTVVIVVLAVALAILGALSVVAAGAQRNLIAKLRRKHWEQEQEIARLHEAVDSWANDYRKLDQGYVRLLDRYEEMANKPPVVIDPPDVAAIVREVGESIGTAIYGRQQEVQEDLQRQMRETSMVHEQPQQGEWYPDVEFDSQMGEMPSTGGWINPRSNQQMPPPEGQTPSHVVIDGQLVRIDGQSVFQSGVGAPQPKGGVE